MPSPDLLACDLPAALADAERSLEALANNRRRLEVDVSRALDDEAGVRRHIEEIKCRIAALTPVDRTARELIGGGDPNDPSHKELLPSGQQRDYVILSAAERAKGFVRPVRDAYRHEKCGQVTTMSRPLAETYARDPTHYSGTFCSTCRVHRPVGADGEFIWMEHDGQFIHKVGT